MKKFAFLLTLLLSLTACAEPDFTDYAVITTGDCIQIEDGEIVSGEALARRFREHELESVKLVYVEDRGKKKPKLHKYELHHAGDAIGFSGRIDPDLAFEITDIILKEEA